jgi:hypothetical protein
MITLETLERWLTIPAETERLEFKAAWMNPNLPLPAMPLISNFWA